MADFTVSFDSSDEKERKRRLSLVYAAILSFSVPENNETTIPHDADVSPSAGDEDTGALDSDIVSDNPNFPKGNQPYVYDF